jgi:hypothetical protein
MIECKNDSTPTISRQKPSDEERKKEIRNERRAFYKVTFLSFWVPFSMIPVSDGRHKLETRSAAFKL